MSMLTSTFSNLCMTPAIVKRLMGFKVNPDSLSHDSASLSNNSTSTTSSSSSSIATVSAANLANHNKLCEKSIRALVKKLKTPGALEELERAITTRDSNTKCITIPLKSAPDRLPRKTLPHVVYCRLWRFADLQNCNELKPLPHCQHGYSHHYSKRSDDSSASPTLVCINPYHYTRIEHNQQSSSNVNDFSGQQPSMLTVYVPKLNQFGKPENIDSNQMDQQQLPPPMPPPFSSNQYGGGAVEMQTQSLSMPNDIQSNNFMMTNQGTSSTSSQINGNGTSGTGSCNYFNSNSPLSPPTSSNSPPILGNFNLNFNRSPPSNSMLQQFSPFLSEDDSSEINDISPSPIGSNLGDLVPVIMAEQPYWCSMSYYEMKQRVGEMFHVASNVHSVTIDGYTDPSSASRFCLGVLSNANRTEEIELTRRYIGRGLTLHYHNGQVFAECLSENPVFVQSANCNQRYNWHLATVIKIPPKCTLKIFDEAAFVQLANETVYQGFEAVYALTRICSIRISFVKGWGESYRRQTVLNTPCWIELHLNNPLKLVDEVLTKMGSPRTKCTSVS